MEVHLYLLVTHFQGPVPRVLAGAPAIPPEWSAPLPPKFPVVGPHRRHCSAAVPPPRDRIKTLHSFWPCGFARARLPCMCHFVEQEIKDKKERPLSGMCLSPLPFPSLSRLHSRVLEIRHRGS